MPRLLSPKVIIYFLLLAVLDGTIMPVFQVRGVYPSFLYLFICYAAFEWGSHKTVYVAFCAGLLRDLLGAGAAVDHTGALTVGRVEFDLSLRPLWCAEGH